MAKQTKKPKKQQQKKNKKKKTTKKNNNKQQQQQQQKKKKKKKTLDKRCIKWNESQRETYFGHSKRKWFVISTAPPVLLILIVTKHMLV